MDDVKNAVYSPPFRWIDLTKVGPNGSNSSSLDRGRRGLSNAILGLAERPIFIEITRVGVARYKSVMYPSLDGIDLTKIWQNDLGGNSMDRSLQDERSGGHIIVVALVGEEIRRQQSLFFSGEWWESEGRQERGISAKDV